MVVDFFEYTNTTFTNNFQGSKPVDGNSLPHILALWSEELSIEKNHEFEMQK